MSRFKRFIPWTLTAIAPFILFTQTLISGEVLFWGTPMLQFIPWRRLGWEMILSGTAPLWNPYAGMGAPLLANYQTAFLYPPNWLLPLIGIEWGHALLMMLHLIVAAWGMILLARRLGFGLVAQTISGLAFSVSGYLVARAWFISIDTTAAWLPWVIWGVEGLAQAVIQEKGKRSLIRSALALSLLLSLQWLAGHAQIAWYSITLAAFWAAWRTYQARGWRRVWRVALYFSASLAIAFLLSAAQLLPTVEYMLQSQRASGLDSEFALAYSFWPWRILGFLMPDLFGNPARGDFWGYGNYWEDAIYIGVVPFMLAVIAAWKSFRKQSPNNHLGRFLLVVSGVSLLFALGDNTPIYPFLFEYIPTFSLFQAPARWNLLLVFSMALLAGMGAAEWKTPEGRGLYWSRLGTAGVAAIGFATYLGMVLIPDVEATFIRAFALAGIWLFVFGLLTLFGRKDGSWKWTVLIGAILAIDLVTAGLGLNPSTEREVYEGTSALIEGADSDHRIYMPAELEEFLKFNEFFRFDTFDPGVDWQWVRDVGMPNVSSLDGIRSANNFDPMLPARYRAWIDELESLSSSEQDLRFGLMDVSRIAVPGMDMPEEIDYIDVDSASFVRILPGAVEARTPNEALQMVMSSGFDPCDELVIEANDASPVDSDQDTSRFTIVERAFDEIEIRVELDGDAWILVSESWYPGWKVEVDGERSTLYRGDYLFMAVRVATGEHMLRFSYQSGVFWMGMIISLASWILTSLSLWRWKTD